MGSAQAASPWRETTLRITFNLFSFAQFRQLSLNWSKKTGARATGDLAHRPIPSTGYGPNRVTVLCMPDHGASEYDRACRVPGFSLPISDPILSSIVKVQNGE